MPLSSLWEALGGLGLFILGMKSMSEGLQRIAGERVRKSLERITGNRLTAALMGSCLSSLLQSSSAASILVIGFVNAGLISLYQALGVLLGTGIGATAAIQFIAFKTSFYSLPIIFIGVLLKFFSRRRRWANAGELLLGAGLVFLGLQTMEAGFVPLSRTTIFSDFHNDVFPWRISAAGVGAALTFLMQSSSAAIGVIIVMATSGMISFPVGAAMVVGDVVGVSLITVIASINGTLAAKRTAFTFLIINITAVLLVLLLFPFFLKLVYIVSPGDADAIISGTGIELVRPNMARHLANVHTLFSVLCLLSFLPLLGFLTRSAKTILPDKDRTVDMEPRPRFIDTRVINTPPIAMLQARNEIRRMAEIAGSMFEEVTEQFYKYDAKRTTHLRQKEEVLDILQREISGFLVLLSRQTLSPEASMQIPIMLRDVTSLEHIGDQNDIIIRRLIRKKEERIVFSGAGMSELRNLSARVAEIVQLALITLAGKPGGRLSDLQKLKDGVAELYETMKDNHLKRLTAGKCTIVAGVIYNDIAAAFVKIAEYAGDILETERGLNSDSTSGGD